ncbi:leucine zipper transcription factor-like protein 1 [Plakobranchus ocellatus]|uniref:Leucine zipper transcription factor-like protein 1 n=1 Tax=Plakobranchus ocellatus TaxID=259542 RepID=A0AAV4CL03_9GAST|nr:leucine zipper transcription factor-like protein 1 [Plakobranchus ocellatus]
MAPSFPLSKRAADVRPGCKTQKIAVMLRQDGSHSRLGVVSSKETRAQLGINEHHQNQVVNYIRFARYQRGQRLRAVDVCFEELKDSRLTDETFTVDEVVDMLDGLLAVVRSEVESELINTAHTNVLMSRQMCQQAEKYHLKLSTDISELENRELLEQIREFEEQEFSGAKKEKDFVAKKLIPINDTGLTQLLNMKIDELQSENEMLLQRLSKFDKEFAGNYQRTKSLTSDLERLQAELRAKGTRPGATSAEVSEMTRQMAELQVQIDQERQKGKVSSEQAEREMASTKHELLRIREMLEMAEKELEKKVSQTTPFKNLKQMLQRKNDQMKDLRKRLMKYEPVGDD